MDINQLATAKKFIGKEKDYNVNDMSFKVKVLGVKQHGPFILYHVTPVAGHGEDHIASFTKRTKPVKK